MTEELHIENRGFAIVAAAAAHSGMINIPEGESEPEIEAPEANENSKDLSLGELNPLIHSVDFSNRPVIESLTEVTIDLISSHGGIKPNKLGTETVVSYDGKEVQKRYIARFEVEKLTEEQFQELESLAQAIYSGNARTRKSTDGKKELEAEIYPPTDKNQMQNRRTAGWYLGPEPIPTSPMSRGILVFKDFGELNSQNLLTKTIDQDKNEQPDKFIVEIREATMYQTDLVELITQVSSILANGGELPHGDLIYEAYYKLMRFGLKDFDPSSVHGMEDSLTEIRRRLIYPLASPDLSRGIGQKPESALIVGVPGTGKTLIAKQLLYEDTGLLIVPVTPMALFAELSTEPEKQRLFKRINSVGRSTRRKVILHVDDIEHVTEEDSKAKSSILNQLAGVTDSGLYIIASTNEPEKISNSLLQPERLGIIIYCGLQDEEARRQITDIHATRKSARDETMLFRSEEERDIILDEIAKRTKGFTPRFLAEIATVAKSYLLERVAKERGTHIELTETDLGENKFTVEDWERALAYVARGYDKEGTIERDRQIKAFIERAKVTLGYKHVFRDVFDPSWKDARDRIAALKESPSED